MLWEKSSIHANKHQKKVYLGEPWRKRDAQENGKSKD